MGGGSRSVVSGTETPLPDMSTLILILNNIQKKDKYCVFAEPVGPEELPDYHEVIKHPMDFGTIRKKLARNYYANLEQFENDVFLVCSNAMQYNAPETIYFKQANSMQALARKKFQGIRAKSVNPENPPEHPKQINKQDSVSDKLIEKSMCLNMLELGRKTFQRARSSGPEVTRKAEQQINQSKFKPEQQINQPKPVIDKPIEKPICRSVQELGRKKFRRAGISGSEGTGKPEQLINQQKPAMAEPIEKSTCRGMQELGRKAPQGAKSKGPEIVQKPDQLIKQPMSDADKQIEKPTCRSPIVQTNSDTSSGAIFTSNKDAVSETKSTEHAGAEKSSDLIAASVPVASETLSEKVKAEEPSEKEGDMSPAPGQKAVSPDENRRATYTMSNKQPLIQLDSLFTVFDGEKQLAAVGLHDETSYARSLARFSATLGPTAWKIASGKIEKALPAGLKFGPGWVGEYEPPLIPIFSFENCFQIVKNHSKNLHGAESRKNQDSCVSFKSKEAVINKSNQVPSSTNAQPAEVYTRVPNIIKEGSLSKGTTEAKQALFGFPLGHKPQVSTDMFQQQRNNPVEHSVKIFADEKIRTDITDHARIVRNGPTDVASARPRYSSELVTSRFMEMGSNDRSCIKSSSSRVSQSQISSVETKHSGVEGGGLSHVQDLRNSNDGKQSASLGFISFNQAGKMSKPAPSEASNQKVDDPVRLIRMLSGKVPNQLNYPNSSLSACTNQFTPVMSPRKLSGIALPTTAQTWTPVATPTGQKSAEVLGSSEVQIGAPLNNKPTWMLPHSISGFHGVDNRLPVSQFLPKTEEAMVPSNGTVAFPQIFTPELSRFHIQSPWQGLVPHPQKWQSKNMLPPDLNISFQSPGSPVQQSSNVLVDSQQPDLALQL